MGFDFELEVDPSYFCRLDAIDWPISRTSEKQVCSFLSFELSTKHVSWNFETLTDLSLINFAI